VGVINRHDRTMSLLSPVSSLLTLFYDNNNTSCHVNYYIQSEWRK